MWRGGRPRPRLVAVLGAALVGFAILLARVALLQTAEASAFRQAGERQRVRATTLPAARGAIFDRNGYELAISIPQTTIWADPRLVIDPAGTANALAPVLGFDAKQAAALSRRLSPSAAAPEREFAYVARQVDDTVAAQVEQLHLPGISTYPEPRRFQPSEDLARSIIGATDPDGKGTAGLELEYDDLLTGEPGELVREKGPDGRTIASGHHELIPPTPGDDLVLTLDRNLQYVTEQMLLGQVRAVQARGGMVVVMETGTGDVLAMANARRNADTGKIELTAANLAAVDTYEPGSVAKIVTAAAALQAGVATPQSSWVIPARKQFSDHVFTDAEPHPTEPMTLAQIIAKSSNIGTMTVSKQLGAPLQEHFMRAFGFGSTSALDFPGEAAGILKPAGKWQGTERYTVAYGQGVAVTAVQLAAAMNTIANHGTYVAPRLVRATIGRDGEETPAPASATHEVLAPPVAAEMNQILREVVCRGTARHVTRIDGYSVAGKTGTAFKARERGGYVDASGRKKYYASFAGFVPAESPRLTILVSIDEPPGSGEHYGAQVAAPLFMDVAREALRRLQVPPSSTGDTCTVGPDQP
jgi:cell division protein FtsI (penicillin-binding protein 3)